MITSPLARLRMPVLFMSALLVCLSCLPTISHARTLYHQDGTTTSYYDEDVDYESDDDDYEPVSYGAAEDARLQKQYDDYNAKHNLKTFSGLPLACKDQYCKKYVSGSY